MVLEQIALASFELCRLLGSSDNACYYNPEGKTEYIVHSSSGFKSKRLSQGGAAITGDNVMLFPRSPKARPSTEETTDRTKQIHFLDFHLHLVRPAVRATIFPRPDISKGI